MIENENAPTYTTLRSIEERKKQLLKDIRRDNQQINKLRKQLFPKQTALTTRRGRKMNMQGLMSTSAGVFDGLLLVWKLYRKFKK
jgi:ribosomal protein L9